MKLIELNIRQRMAMGFGLIIVLMISITGAAAFQLFQSNQRLGGIVNDQYPQTVLVNTMKSDLADVVGNMRNILLLDVGASSQTELSLIEQGNQFIDESGAKLDALVKASAPSNEATGHMTYLKEKKNAFMEVQKRFLDLVRNARMDDARGLMLTEVRAVADSYGAAVDRLVQYQGTLADSAGRQATTSTRAALLLMASLASVATITGIGIAVRVTLGITRPLNQAVGLADRVANGDLASDITVRSSDEIGKLMTSLKHMNQSLARTVGEVRGGTDTIATASVQIASGMSQLSQRTEEQASALQETAASVGLLSATVKQNAGHAQQGNQLGRSATAAAVKGGEVVAQVIDTMGLIRESSRRIGDIIGVIDGIAFQTNILALNAAVEAARAGDLGRGFAVVAQEVRNLAQRSALAAKEIKTLVSDSMDKVDAGSQLVDRAGEMMGAIVDSVSHVAGIMSNISAASSEQDTGIASVQQAIDAMNDITGMNAALVEEATAATESLREQAATLARAVSVFRLESSEPADPLTASAAPDAAQTARCSDKPAPRASQEALSLAAPRAASAHSA
jgi:methyl-accepting chemotaxis protein